jgi:hypothetical protein
VQFRPFVPFTNTVREIEQPLLLSAANRRSEFIATRAKVADTARPLDYRFSSNGDALPIVGFIVDSLDDIYLDAAVRQLVRIDDALIDIVDGVFEDKWHFVIAVRPEEASVDLTHADAQHNVSRSVVSALHQLRVRQIISSATARFDPAAYFASMNVQSEIAAEFVDLAAMPIDSISVASSSCDRLRVALSHALDDTGFTDVPVAMREFLDGVAVDERAAAREHHMCYAAVEWILPPSTVGERSVRSRLTAALTHAYDVISPLASCTCAL